MITLSALPAIDFRVAGIVDFPFEAAGAYMVATTLAGSFIDPATTLKAPDGVKVGTYQVGFKGPCGNVQIQNGWFRIVQPDTLTFGTLPARSCTVADRFNVHNAIWIQC